MNRKAVVIILSALILCLSACGNDKGVDEVMLIEDGRIVSEGASATSEAPGGEELIIAEHGDMSFSAALRSLLIYKSLSATADEYGLKYADLSTEKVLGDNGEVLTAGEKAEKYAGTVFEKIYFVYSTLEDKGLKAEDAPSATESAARAKDDYLAHQGIYSQLGIGMEELVIFHSYEDLYMWLFERQYGEGGENEIPIDGLKEIMEERMRRIQYTYLPFYDDETMEDFSGEQINKLKRQSAEYLRQYNSGADFSEIVRENYLYLDGYGLFFDIGNVDIYYSKYKPDSIASEIYLCAEALEENSAVVVNADFYSSVVLRLPVNGSLDERWKETALREAYYSKYGKEFETNAEASLLKQIIQYNEDALKSVSPSDISLKASEFIGEKKSSK